MNFDEALERLKADRELCKLDPGSGKEVFPDAEAYESYQALGMAIEIMESVKKKDD